MERKKSLIIPTAIMVISIGLAGCASESHKPTSKQFATQQWNAARASVLFGLARQQFEAGNLDQSRKSCDEALALDPSSAQLYILSARIYIEQGRLEPAESALQEARKDAPANPDADYLSGVIYQRWQKPAIALDFYASAATKAPAELQYLMAKSEMLVTLNRPEEALSELQAKVQYFENSAAIRDAIGELLSQLGRNTDAIAMFRQASMLAGDDLSIREHLALALFEDAQYREANELFERLTADPRDAHRADLFAAMAECQMQASRPRDARAMYETATEIAPNNAPYWLGLAEAALALGDTRRAELSIGKAISLDPGGADGQLMLGYLRLRQNSLIEALAAFNKSSVLDPNDSTAPAMIGYIYEKLGKNEQAVRYYARALKIKPNDALASRLLAEVNVRD